MEHITIHCSCCDLSQHVKDRPGARPTVCSRCGEHRGADELSTRHKLESHLEMAQERLAAASRWAEQAERDRNTYKERMHWAYGSRENAIRKLRALAEHHEPMGRGACSCRRRACESMPILDQPWVRSMILRLDEIEDERAAELLAPDEADEWSVMAWDRPFDGPATTERTGSHGLAG